MHRSSGHNIQTLPVHRNSRLSGINRHASRYGARTGARQGLKTCRICRRRCAPRPSTFARRRPCAHESARRFEPSRALPHARRSPHEAPRASRCRPNAHPARSGGMSTSAKSVLAIVTFRTEPLAESDSSLVTDAFACFCGGPPPSIRDTTCRKGRMMFKRARGRVMLFKSTLRDALTTREVRCLSIC